MKLKYPFQNMNSKEEDVFDEYVEEQTFAIHNLWPKTMESIS